MRELTPHPFSSPLKKHGFTPAILGEFKIDHQQFFIIDLESDLENVLENDEENHFTAEISDSEFCCSELSNLPCHDFIELGRFRCQGQTCAIVKLNHTHKPIEVNLATLLTERELQIAALVASGRANKQIANQLHISEWTVSTHLRRIFIKLGVDSRAAMVYRCASLIQELFGQEETAPKTSASSTT